MEDKFIIISINPSDGILFDMPVLVTRLTKQDECSNYLLEHLPYLFLVQDHVGLLFGEEVLMQWLSLLKNVGFVGVDEHWTDIALHEDLLGQSGTGVYNEVFGVVFLRRWQRNKGLFCVLKEWSCYSSLLEVQYFECVVYHGDCYVIYNLFAFI